MVNRDGYTGEEEENSAGSRGWVMGRSRGRMFGLAGEWLTGKVEGNCSTLNRLMVMVTGEEDGNQY